jgi:diaminohydroxyphosphoribosylaminopyrimidine deaminase/5-amino-6-(5-phosphoribosylamino)uracil reductase
LRLLAARGVTRVFSEGGPAVAESLIAHGYADEVILHRGVKPLGRPGKLALTPAARHTLADEHRYRLFQSRRLGADEMTHYIKAG